MGVEGKERKAEMKYIVSVKVDGRIDLEVEADSANEAFEKVKGMDFPMSKVQCVGAEPVNCEDENGNLTDY